MWICDVDFEAVRVYDITNGWEPFSEGTTKGPLLLVRRFENALSVKVAVLKITSIVKKEEETVSAPVKKDEESGSRNLGAIIGGAVGGGVVLLGAIAAAVMCNRQKEPAQQAFSDVSAIAPTTVVVQAQMASVRP